jgi:Golgi SNAP receptor complex protein 1
MSTFTQIRNQILQLEKQTDSWLTKLSTYEKSLAVKENVEEEENIKTNLNNCINQRDELLGKLNRINEFENLSTSKLQQLTRHKEILVDHKRIITKLTNLINEIKNKNNLLFSIRSDLDSHKARSAPQQIDSNDYILEESVRANSFNDIAQGLLNSAYRTRDELMNQRGYLNNAQMTISGTIQQIPGINVLISRINTRRRRDTLILATVIAVCIILLFFI